MASAASTIAAKPFVSIMPSASAMSVSLPCESWLALRKETYEKKSSALRRFFADDRLERAHRGLRGGIDLRLRAREVEAAERAEERRVDELHVRGLECFVRGVGDVSRRLALEDEERLARDQHRAEAHAVD